MVQPVQPHNAYLGRQDGDVRPDAACVEERRLDVTVPGQLSLQQYNPFVVEINKHEAW